MEKTIPLEIAGLQKIVAGGGSLKGDQDDEGVLPLKPLDPQTPPVSFVFYQNTVAFADRLLR